RRGTQCFGPCPIHGGTNRKQFVVNPNTNEWKCFSPGHNSGGGTLEFVAEMERTTVRDAGTLVARWFAIGAGSPCNQPAHQRRRVMSGSPSHRVYVVDDPGVDADENDKGWWTKVGSAWPHKDGKGLNIQLASGVAVSGRIVLREYTEKDAEEDAKR